MFSKSTRKTPILQKYFQNGSKCTKMVHFLYAKNVRFRSPCQCPADQVQKTRTGSDTPKLIKIDPVESTVRLIEMKTSVFVVNILVRNASDRIFL